MHLHHSLSAPDQLLLLHADVDVLRGTVFSVDRLLNAQQSGWSGTSGCRELRPALFALSHVAGVRAVHDDVLAIVAVLRVAVLLQVLLLDLEPPDLCLLAGRNFRGFGRFVVDRIGYVCPMNFHGVTAISRILSIDHFCGSGMRSKVRAYLTPPNAASNTMYCPVRR